MNRNQSIELLKSIERKIILSNKNSEDDLEGIILCMDELNQRMDKFESTFRDFRKNIIEEISVMMETLISMIEEKSQDKKDMTDNK